MKNDMQENQPVTIDGAFMARNCLDVMQELDKAGRKQNGN